MYNPLERDRMEDSPAAPGGEQPQAPAPAQQGTTPATPTIESVLGELDITSLSDDQLADLESGDHKKLAALLKIPTEEAPPAASAEAPVPPAGAKANDDILPEGPGNPEDGPTRISLRALPDKASRQKMASVMADMREGKYKTLNEAIAAHFTPPAARTEPPAAAATPKEELAATIPTAATDIQALEAKLADIEKRRSEAKLAFEYDAIESLTLEAMEVKYELREAKLDASRQATSQSAWVQKEDDSRERALSKFSEYLTDPEHPFQDLLEIELLRATRAQDPILNNPDWPENIAARVFEKHKKQWGGGAADPAEPIVQTPIPPAPKPGVRMPGSPINDGANTAALTAQAAMAEFDALSPEEQKAVLAKLDPTVL